MIKPRIRDIAERVGVSTATVSRALSGKGYVKEDLADRIRVAAYEMNYALPDTVQKRKALLVASQNAMVDMERSQFTLHVIEGLKLRAEALGIEVETRTFRSTDDLKAMREQAETESHMGALFLSVDDDTLPLIRDLPCPVVLVNSDDPGMKLNSVTPCNRSAASLAAGHLVSLGHRKILFITKPGRRTVLRRLEGLRDVMGDGFASSLVVTVADWTVEAGKAAIQQAIEDKLDFTAVLAAGDILAVGAILGIQEMGLSVPGDVSVIGIDDLPQSEYLTPPLTTVSIPMREIGVQAIDILNRISKMRGASAQMPVMRVELACRLVERASSAEAAGYHRC